VKAQQLKDELLALVDEDTAHSQVMDAFRVAKDSADEKERVPRQSRRQLNMRRGSMRSWKLHLNLMKSFRDG